MDSSGTGDRSRPAARDFGTGNSAGRALRRERLLRSGLQTQFPGGCGVLAHRAVFARSDRSARRPAAAALSVAERGAGLFRCATYSGAGRRRVRPRLGRPTCRHAGGAGTRTRGAARQVRYLVGPARRAVFRIRLARLAASRSVPPGTGRGDGMSGLARDSVLRLAPGCRLNAAGGPEDLLLIPEGALRLKGPARTIVELCDGERSLGEIVVELQRTYPSAQPARIETEALALLARLRDRGVLEYA